MYTYNKIQVSVWSYKASNSFHFAAKSRSYIKLWSYFQEDGFDEIVHFNDEENIVTYVDFDCGITFYPEAPTKVGQTNRKRNSISRS